MRLAAQAKGGFYPTPPRVTDLVAQLIYAPIGPRRNQTEQTLRLLDPCCGSGDALAQLAGDLRGRSSQPVETFGVELHQERSTEAAERIDRVLATDLFRCSIANRAFGLLLLNPPYDHDGEQKRTEHAFLTQCSRYLAPDGLLMFIAPRRRLSVSARYLASHYRRLGCWAFPEPERELFDQVVVIGERKSEPTPDLQAERELTQWVEGELEPLSTVRYPLYDAPPSPAGEILFTTRTVDPEAGSAEARRSGLWQSPVVTDALWSVEDARTRPVMPLRRGHLAILVAAGFLDNRQLEAGDSRILVKGRTRKELVLVEDTLDKEVYRERLATTVTALDLETGEITEIDA